MCVSVLLNVMSKEVKVEKECMQAVDDYQRKIRTEMRGVSYLKIFET